MTSTEESKLIEKAKLGDEDSLKKIIAAHSGICVDMYRKYTGPNIPGYLALDIQSSKDYIIFNSVKTFDPSRGSKFSTWLANQTRYFCLNSINKSSKLVQVEEDSLLSLIERQNLESDLLEKNIQEEHANLLISEIKEAMNGMKNKKIKTCIQKKYFPEDGKNKTYTEIAKEMNVTVQTVINWHNKFISFMKNKYNKQYSN
jgi:RNA polymerase sigma factor (sigma-70 family)